MKLQTTDCPARLPIHSAGTDACRSSGFIGDGQTFKFFFDAPPRKPLLWACLLAWASRDLYPVCLWFARALIPHPMQRQRHRPFKMQNWNLEVISQLEPPPPPPVHPFILFLYSPPPRLFLHIFRYNYGGSLQMFLLFFPSSRFEEMTRNVMLHQ